MTTALDVARAYLGRGWAVVPVPFKSKRPVLAEWQQLRLAVADVAGSFNGQPSNIGVLLGAPSGGLVDIDLDCPEAIILADRFLLPTPSVFGRSGKRRSHRLYLRDLATEKFADVENGADDPTAMIVEIRSTGGQTVFPGSTHPSGEGIEWAEDREPARVDAPELRRAVVHLACAAILARHWAPDGLRHDCALAAAGFLARGGIADDLVVKIIMAAARQAGDTEWSDRKRAALDTVAAIRTGEPTTGGPRLAELLVGDGAKVVARMRRWLGGAADSDSRPEIDTAHLGLDDMAAAAWAAIAEQNTPPRVFLYAGALAWLVDTATDPARIEIMNQDHVRHHLADVATFIRWSAAGRGRTPEKRPAFPPPPLAAVRPFASSNASCSRPRPSRQEANTAWCYCPDRSGAAAGRGPSR